MNLHNSTKFAAASRVCRVSHQKDRLDNYGLSHGVNDFLKQTKNELLFWRFFLCIHNQKQTPFYSQLEHLDQQ